MNIVVLSYIILQGVPYPALPKRDKPRRVEHYFSSWVIRAGEYSVIQLSFTKLQQKNI